MTRPSTARAPRRDAVENRARLVEAAEHAFREAGLGASVNAIADRAGVNVATLYRHFATKDELIAAVLEAVLKPLALARDRALRIDDAGEALATFLREAIDLHTEHHGLTDALARSRERAHVRAQLRQPAIDIVTPLVERAHEAGVMRPDLDPVDLLIALRMLLVAAEVRDADATRTDRHVDVILRGLRPD